MPTILCVHLSNCIAVNQYCPIITIMLLYFQIPYAIESSSSAAGYNNKFDNTVWNPSSNTDCTKAQIAERLCGRVFSVTPTDTYSTFNSGKQSICSK